MKNNVIDFELYKLRQESLDLAQIQEEGFFETEYYEGYEDVDFGDVGYEVIYIPEPVASNDNYSDIHTFEELLNFFIPETVEDYEKLFKTTFDDFENEVWFNPETHSFETPKLN